MSLRKMSFKRSLKKSGHHYKTVSINLLDNNASPIEIEITNEMTGHDLLENVCTSLGGLLEKDYFGLRYMYRDNYKRWLEGTKSVYHQIKKARTTTISLRVRHYPSNPVDDVVQDLARYFFYLQLRLDLYSGNLIVKGEPLFKLISLVIQAEHGDLLDHTQEEVFALITNLKVVENINEKIVLETCYALQSVKELEGKEAERQFLILVSQLDSYGVEPFAVMDDAGDKLFLAMNHQGICTFFGEKRKHIYYWENISKMMFIKKIFVFEINVENKKKRLTFKFNCESVAKEFWKWALDRQYFMTLNNSSEAKKVKSNNVIFSRKVVYRFSGRSMKELTSSCHTLDKVPQPPILRSYSTKAVCRNSVNLDGDLIKGDMYSTLPRRSKTNKEISSSIDFEGCMEDKDNMVTSTTSEESMLMSSRCVEDLDNESELPVIAEDKIIEETLEPTEVKVVEALFEGIEDAKESDDEYMDDELRERHIDDHVEDDGFKTVHQPITEQLHLECNNIEANYRFHNIDGMFFVKFVILTTLILLVIMITSLVAYYYYRSSTIADLNKHKYSSEWNKNIDLESIKRFVLRNDAP